MHVISEYGVADRERDIAVPSVFYIGKDGMIAWTHIGESITNRPTCKTLLEIARRGGKGAGSSRSP